jgi:hypothetical protein
MFTAFCGANVTGSVGPAKWKPVPETEACEIVRLNLVPLLMAIDLIKVLPSGTLPKLMLEEDAVCPMTLEAQKIRAETRNQQTGLKGELGQVILFSSLPKYLLD